MICYRINSEHNRKVVNYTVEEVGTTKFIKRQIQGTNNTVYFVLSHQNFGTFIFPKQLDGVKIYRKSLKDSGKGISRDTRIRVRIRSRQQRVRNPVEYFTL